MDDCRRVHDYDEFIQTFLAMLAERGQLGDLLEHSLNLTRYVLTSFFCETVFETFKQESSHILNVVLKHDLNHESCYFIAVEC